MEFENMLQQGATIHEVEMFARSIIEGERNRIATLANISALLNQYLSQINWVGFYLLVPKTDSLVLGPFQGLVACTRITVGQGVVGNCVKLRQTIVVPNVLEFPGHIACDSQSRSEIVVPIYSGQQIVGVLDVDSPEFDRFHEPEQAVLETVAQLLGENWTLMTNY
ncbi:GAF domain-containing protein [Sulfobacillus thermosulfidooxidans]|uniref:GAF domain-containing protein n=1 Tax=Sulfobacillus thermosulfidooxidans TaxID=28034 RepID=UPI0006B551A8|nr:GAF domain-containing protein [Sulfobacillus thermosulfidooxidans]